MKLEQEPIFSYKSDALIGNKRSGIWVVAYTERVARICVIFWIDAYEQYRLWYVTSHVITVARCLYMDMAFILGSRENVRKLLEMFEFIQLTHFITLPNPWHERAGS